MKKSSTQSSNGGGAHAFLPKTTVDVRLGWPQIYPENKVAPFVFHMRLQMVKDEENIQRDFLMLSDEEHTQESYHAYDVEMLSRLSVAPPEGFIDFPSGDDRPLQEIIREYFMPEDPQKREGMRFICRGAMSRYWNAVLPADYL